MLRVLLNGGVFIAIFLLSACQTTTLAPDGETRLSRFDPKAAEITPLYKKRQLVQDYWLVNGKFSFSSPSESGQGRFKWQRNSQAGIVDRLRLFGPFGAGAVSLESGVNGATFKSGKIVKGAGSIEELSLNTLGWLLPYTELQYWLFGLPVDTQTAWVARNTSGYLVNLKQSGWDIVFDGQKSAHLAALGDEVFVLPKRIMVNHPATQTKVKLVLSSVSFVNED